VKRDKNVQKKKQEAARKPQKQPASGTVITGSTRRSRSRHMKITRYLQKLSSSGRHPEPPIFTNHRWTRQVVALMHKKREKNSLAHASHAPSRRDHHGCGLTQPDLKKLVTTMEECVSREDQPKTTDLTPKISQIMHGQTKPSPENSRTTTPSTNS
jgi:hypothetical protein